MTRQPTDGWTERDNFESEDQAEGYIRALRTRFGPKQPYRIVGRAGRYIVEFIPGYHPANPYFGKD